MGFISLFPSPEIMEETRRVGPECYEDRPTPWTRGELSDVADAEGQLIAGSQSRGAPSIERGTLSHLDRD